MTATIFHETNLLRRSPLTKPLKPTLLQELSSSPTDMRKKRPRETGANVSLPIFVLIITLMLLFGLSCSINALSSETDRRDLREVLASKPTPPLTTGQASTNTTVADTSPSLYSDEVVQVIQTRFMQNQPHLVDLGLARLKIFEFFCLPTMVHQTSQNFVWIIRTDPELHERVKLPLLALLRDYPNYVLVASNENHEGFRNPSAIHDVNESTVWTGDLNRVRNIHATAQTRIVLESRLDADDGLHANFVKYMQKTAPLYIPHHHSWTVWCASQHLEWQYSSPFSSKRDAEEGYWIGIKQTQCVTPGLTMVYGRNVNRSDLPRGKHHLLHETIKPCKHHLDDHCLQRFEALTPAAIRVRSPTSAGMGNLVIGKQGNRRMYANAANLFDLQPELWGFVRQAFHVSVDDAKTVRDYMKNHMVAIASDNLKGQCTKGHSCKKASTHVLKRIISDESLK